MSQNDINRKIAEANRKAEAEKQSKGKVIGERKEKSKRDDTEPTDPKAQKSPEEIGREKRRALTNPPGPLADRFHNRRGVRSNFGKRNAALIAARKAKRAGDLKTVTAKVAEAAAFAPLTKTEQSQIDRA